ncbi:MAG TPA: hypothetical protein VKA14_00625 [Gammaproteobacteria bacterium]|nr:hypothetical protein [Gammaproteobacteria bacterium]
MRSSVLNRVHNIGALGLRLIRDHACGFPLVREPYARVAGRLGVSEREVLATFEALQATGLVSRVGPVFRAPEPAVTALGAVAVPEGRLEAAVAAVSRYPQVRESRAYDHHFNLWFTVGAAGTRERDQVLADIARQSGLGVLALPQVEVYDRGPCPRHSAPVSTCAHAGAARIPLDRRLVAAVRDGLPLDSRPYRAVGRRCELSETEVIGLLRHWLARGVVARVGVVEGDRALDGGAFAMAAWDLPEERVRDAGRGLAAFPFVVRCVRRPRRPPHWPYNLVCTLGGRGDAPLRARAELVGRVGIGRLPDAVLHARRYFKHRGAAGDLGPVPATGRAAGPVPPR